MTKSLDDREKRRRAHLRHLLGRDRVICEWCLRSGAELMRDPPACGSVGFQRDCPGHIMIAVANLDFELEEQERENQLARPRR